MAIFEWSESLKVNIEDIDLQHQQLIETIGKLEVSIREGSSRESMKEIFDQLTQYLDKHFQREEQVFGFLNYPLAESHKKEHLDFINKITRFKNDFDSGKVGLTVEMLNFLCEWVRNHLKGADQKYATFIARQQKDSGYV